MPAKRKHSDVKKIDNYYGGAFVAPSTGNYMPVENPADGSIIAEVAVSAQSDVDAAVRAASAAYQTWGKTDVKKRVQVMFKFKALVEEHVQELAEIASAEHGKNVLECKQSIAKGNETVEYACCLPQLIQGRNLQVSSGVTCQDSREPLGVVAAIVPFNFPFMVPMWTIPISIGMGNTVVLKPSEKVPMTMYRVAELFKEAGLPDGVFNIVNGTADVVNGLCDHPLVQAVSFVGSTKVAELVAKRGRASNKRVLALGGAKNHLVALADADADMTTTDIIASAFGSAGQRCMAASVLLPVGEQPEMIKMLVDKAAKLTAGQTPGQLGPVIDAGSKARILKYVDEAEAGGAKILLDGRKWACPSDGHWVGPTVLLHSSPTEAAMKDEIFGPVLSIYVCKDRDEAIAIENGCEYGNAACIYTSIGQNADWFTSRFTANMLGVNVGVPVPREPFSFGGMGTSKFGETDITGDGAIEFFSRRQKITTKWVPPSAANKSWMN